MQLLALLLAAAPLLALGGEPSWSRRRALHHKRALASRDSSYSLVKKYQGNNFFDDWYFFTEADPTGGQVKFLGADDAKSKKLAYVQDDGTAVIAVDDYTTLAAGESRNSVRITSKENWSTGLFIADMWDVPHGCGTWPAYWTVGPNWPVGGEIDIFEVTHEDETNQIAFHSGPGCQFTDSPTPLATSAKTTTDKAFTGNIFNKNCVSSDGDNSGCGTRANDTYSAGRNFNMMAGGVYAHKVDETGIAVWFFPRNNIPADIQAGTPNPATWDRPVALLSNSGCDIASHFYNQSIIFDITLCGGYGSATFGNNAACKATAATCSDAIKDPSNFNHAKFKINYVAVYQEK